jgi:ATP-dependent Lon protease
MMLEDELEKLQKEIGSFEKAGWKWKEYEERTKIKIISPKKTVYTDDYLESLSFDDFTVNDEEIDAKNYLDFLYKYSNLNHYLKKYFWNIFLPDDHIAMSSKN